MIDRKELKARAKAQLGGRIFSNKWMTALLVCLIVELIAGALTVPGAISSVITTSKQLSEFAMDGDAVVNFSVSTGGFGGTFGTISSIVILILMGPLNFGLAKLFLLQTRNGGDMNIGGVFDGFKEDVGGNIILNIMIGIFTFLWSLLFIIPGIVKSLAYSMSFYVKADHPDWDWKECLNESKRLMNGHKGELFVLQLSFIGWYIVGALCLGIGTLWVAPYVAATESQFYQNLAYPGMTFNDAPDAEVSFGSF